VKYTINSLYGTMKIYNSKKKKKQKKIKKKKKKKTIKKPFVLTMEKKNSKQSISNVLSRKWNQTSIHHHSV